VVRVSNLIISILAALSYSSSATIVVGGAQLLQLNSTFPKFDEFVLPGNPEGRFLFDASFSTLKRADGMMTFISNSWVNQYKFESQLNKPLTWGGQINVSSNFSVVPIYMAWRKHHTELWLNEPNLRNRRPDEPNLAYWSAWIPNIYERSNGDLLGFVHIEDFTQCFPDGTPDWPNTCTQKRFRIGLAYSKNRGDNWTYCGHILAPFMDAQHSNIGGVPYLVVNSGEVDYFYVYFNEHTVFGKRISVARARVSDVLNAAQSGTVTAWSKMGGTPAAPNWTQSGLTGLGEVVLTQGTPGYGTLSTYDTHSDAARSIGNLNKFLLTLFVDDPANTTTGRYALTLFSSTNGLIWQPESNLETSTTALHPFSTFVAHAGANNDNSQVGNNFDITYSRRYDLVNHQVMDLYRRQITINP